jgi:hypothetical protein
LISALEEVIRNPDGIETHLLSQPRHRAQVRPTGGAAVELPFGLGEQEADFQRTIPGTDHLELLRRQRTQPRDFRTDTPLLDGVGVEPPSL